MILCFSKAGLGGVSGQHKGKRIRPSEVSGCANKACGGQKEFMATTIGTALGEARIKKVERGKGEVDKS